MGVRGWLLLAGVLGGVGAWALCSVALGALVALGVLLAAQGPGGSG
jgi:hypothetical protein